MISERNLKDLRLTEEQLKTYRELEAKEKALRSTLKKCGVFPGVVEKIISNSDLNRVDLENLEALEETVKTEWSEFMMGDRKE